MAPRAEGLLSVLSPFWWLSLQNRCCSPICSTNRHLLSDHCVADRVEGSAESRASSRHRCRGRAGPEQHWAPGREDVSPCVRGGHQSWAGGAGSRPLIAGPARELGWSCQLPCRSGTSALGQLFPSRVCSPSGGRACRFPAPSSRRRRAPDSVCVPAPRQEPSRLVVQAGVLSLSGPISVRSASLS